MKKYIVLGNGNEWCEKSLINFISRDDTVFSNKYLPLTDNVFEKLARVHFCYSINQYIRLPFKGIWYSSFIKYLKMDDVCEDYVVLIYDRHILANDFKFINYMRKKYVNIKFVYLFTNIVEFSGAKERNYVNELKKHYDVVFAFDPVDAEKYNFSYSPLIYDADYALQNKSDENENRVFYVGKAKDRFNMLITCYEKLKEIGIECDFSISEVPMDIQAHKGEITYNTFMPYNVAVDKIIHSTCLIDIIQGNSTGLTIKTCEAICYNKKLITTNCNIKDYPFYDERFIRIIDKADDIDLDFFLKNTDVKYPEKGKDYFSVNKFLDRLNKELGENIL